MSAVDIPDPCSADYADAIDEAEALGISLLEILCLGVCFLSNMLTKPGQNCKMRWPWRGNAFRPPTKGSPWFPTRATYANGSVVHRQLIMFNLPGVFVCETI